MKGDHSYRPPYEITPKIVRFVSEISELIGRYSTGDKTDLAPRLRRSNRLRTIHASLAIENNTLSLDQVTAIINGKRVLGKPQEIMEVENAFAVYEKLEQLDPLLEKDFLYAHKILMKSLVPEYGKYRSGGAGIMNGERLVHMAPPAKRVPALMADLFGWLLKSDEHPLITSSVFHYEIEFIHPFADGNGRMGRFWQTLILSHWKQILAYLPVETVIRNQQKEYYGVLAQADKEAHATGFIEFILESIKKALVESAETDQVGDQVSDQVEKLLAVFQKSPLSAKEIMNALSLSHRPTFRKNYLHPALDMGLIEMTRPEKPSSSLQKYSITHKGRDFCKDSEETP